MPRKKSLIGRRKKRHTVPCRNCIKKEADVTPPVSLDWGDNIAPEMSEEDQTVAFDGTVIKQEQKEPDGEDFEKEVSEVKVTLPTGSGVVASTRADVAAKRIDGDTKECSAGRSLLRSMIKQEPVDVIEVGVRDGREGETTRTAVVDPGGNIVCSGNTEGDQWVVQQVATEEGEEQQEWEGHPKADINSPQQAQFHTKQLVNRIIQSAISNGLLTPSVDQNMDTSVSDEQEDSSSQTTVLANPASRVKRNLCSLLIRNMLGTIPTANETTSSSSANHLPDAGQSMKSEVEDPAFDTQSVSPDMQSVSPDMQSVSPDMQSVSPDMQSVSQDMQSVSQDMQSVSQDMQSVFQDMQSVSQVSTSGTRDSSGEYRERKCDYCGKVCPTADNYKFHCLYHTSMATLNVDGITVECTECKTQLPRSYIKYHLKIHLGAKPHVCTLCNKAFIHQRSLLHHTKLHSRKKQSFSCSICSKEYAHEYLLRRHSVIHEKYKCPICGHYSSDKHKFASHKNKHETKVFTCDICGKNYSKEASLFSHKSSVHNATGNVSSGKLIMYKCEDCGDVFPKIPMLKDHLLICEERERKNLMKRSL